MTQHFFTVDLGDLCDLLEVDVGCEVEAADFVEYGWPVLHQPVVLDATEGVRKRMVFAIVDDQCRALRQFNKLGNVFGEVIR